ncbi:hypothetical protein F01_520037 [Burkholderia cenocepacia]|nr:hypothetical protein F01_520037 [Burkholderia cenocepacia]
MSRDKSPDIDSSECYVARKFSIATWSAGESLHCNYRCTRAESRTPTWQNELSRDKQSKVLSRIGDLWSVKNSCCWSTLAAWRHIVGKPRGADCFRRCGLFVCPSVSCHVTTGRDAGKFKRWRLYGEERPDAVAKKRLRAAKALARAVARPNSYRRADPQGLTQCCRALSQRLRGVVMICPHL